MAVKPIKPSEVAQQKLTDFPDEVIEAFNELIAANYNNGYSQFKQKAVINLMISKGLTLADITDKNWLNVDSIYEKAGWKVSYDKPGHSESYDATFMLENKRKV